MLRNIKLAFKSLKAARWRTNLTVLGVVVGVTSVVTIVSIGEGLQDQIGRQVSTAGAELVTVRPGRLVERDEKGKILKVNYTNVVSSGSLTEEDISVISKTNGVKNAVPFGVVSGVPKFNNKSFNEGRAIATSSNLLAVTSNKLAFGSMFTNADKDKPVAVIGAKVAEGLFEENAPIGRAFDFRGKRIVVRGVLDIQPPSPQDLGVDYNYAIFMPYELAKSVSGGQPQIYQVLVQSLDSQDLDKTVDNITANLMKAHGGDDDFTVLQTADNLAIANNATTLLTTVIAALAAISVLVGGIGVMNIMLVAVSERTYEIGVRKSVGATTHHIRSQFLTEAVILSGIGGYFGVLLSILANYLLRVFTVLEPSFNPELYLAAMLGAVGIGVVFGLTPALKAANKDPIESLRRTN